MKNSAMTVGGKSRVLNCTCVCVCVYFLSVTCLSCSGLLLAHGCCLFPPLLPLPPSFSCICMPFLPFRTSLRFCAQHRTCSSWFVSLFPLFVSLICGFVLRCSAVCVSVCTMWHASLPVHHGLLDYNVLIQSQESFLIGQQHVAAVWGC